MKKTPIGLASLVGFTASAFGQSTPTYDARLCFALGNTAGGAVIDNDSDTVDFSASTPGRYLFQVVGGIFNAMNFDSIPSPPGVPQASSNRGVGNWIGAINSSEGNLNIRQNPPGTNQARVAPFNFGLPAGEGTDGDTMITAIDAARGSAEIVWNDCDSPAPQPASLGNEMFTRLYRFNIDITDFSIQRDILITASGTMIAIANWGILSQVPCETPGYVVSWAPVPAGGPQVAESCTLRIRVVPAPGAVFLGLWSLAGVRRRRARSTP